MALTTHRGKLVFDKRHCWENGRVERIRLRVPEGQQSPRKAAAFERKMLAMLEAGIDPRRWKEEDDAPAPKRKAPRLREFWPEFVEYQGSNANKRKNRPRTLYEIEKLFFRWIDPVLGTRPLDQIGARDADRLAAALESGRITGRQLSAASVANALGLLRRMLSVAHRWGIIESVPEIDATKPKPDKLEDDQWLTNDETTRLLDAATDPWRPVMILALRTGLRLGELRALRWCDVDLPGQRILVRRSWDDRTQVMGPPKGGQSREVPMTWDAVETLRALPRNEAEPEALVFPGETGVPFSRSSFARAMELTATEAGIAKHVHPHMTRHTYASHCVAQGIPSRVLMTWGGWQSEAMLARYAHLQPREVEHWVDRIAPPGGPLRAIDGGKSGYRLGTSKEGNRKRQARGV